MLRSETSSIGLFISPESITVVHAGVEDGRTSILRADSAPVPPDCFNGTTISDPGRMGAAIRTLLREMNVTIQATRVALHPDAFSLRPFRLPEAPVAERRAMVRGELDSSGTLSRARDEFDFMWLPAPDEQGRRQADAYTYYTDGDCVESIRETMRSAGLHLEGVEPSSVALLRSFASAQPSPIALLCTSRHSSDLSIFDGSHVRSLRRIAAGSDDFDAGTKPQPRVRFTPDDGLTSPDAAPDGGGHANIEFLVSEVARSLAFFTREFPDEGGKLKLVIISDDSSTARLTALLREATPIPISSENNLAYFGLSGSRPGSESLLAMLSAVGATLASVRGAIPTMNLAQQSAAARVSRTGPVALLAGVSGSVVWMVASLVAAGVLTILSFRQDQKKVDITKETEAIQLQRAPLLLKQRIWEAAQAEKAKSQAPAASALGRVAASTTQGVAVTDLKVTTDGKIAVEGKAANSDSMQRFADELGKGRAIRSPSFEAMKESTNAGLTFKIVGSSHGSEAPAVKPGT